MLITRWRLALVAALLVAFGFATALSSADDARVATSSALTDAEKAKVRELVKLMWKMAREDGLTETLDDCLNPMGQGGDQTCYETTTRRPPFGSGPTRMTEALRHYLEMMRNNKLCKDSAISAGGWTYPSPGLGADSVGISKALLDTWCNPMANSVERAKAKFWIMATLANEAAHVYQKRAPAGSTAPVRDRIACDAERDSDIMSIKYLMRTISRMTDANGNPLTSLDDIEAMGSVGRCLAMCLRDLGVDTAPEIADVVAWLKDRKAVYEDRKANLFENQISQAQSWRRLY
jgi:hypothetical protein